MRQLRGVFLSIVLSCTTWGADTKKGQDWLTRYSAWLCKVSGYGCKDVTKAAKTRRADNPRPIGGDLMTYDLKGPQGRFIWQNCGCWSPMLLGADSLSVVTEDGIWLVPLSHPTGRKLILKSSVVRELLNASGSPSSILFLQSTKADGCAFDPYLLNTDTFRVTPAPAELDLECGKEWDDQKLKEPAQTVDGNTSTSALYNGKYKIYLETKDGTKQLLPAAGGADLDCFDAVWITPSILAFVSGQ